VLFSRLGSPDRTARNRFIRRFEPLFPTNNYEVNADLCQLLVYLETPGIAEKALKLVAQAPSQEEQMEYIKSLRNLETGWTPQARREYFSWFQKAANYKGGQRFQQYVSQLKQEAVATLNAKEKEELKPLLAAKTVAPEVVAKPRPLVKQWTLAELAPVVEQVAAERAGRLKASTHRFGLFLDEYGYQTRPPDKTAGVSPATQDRWLQMAAYRAWRDPRVRLLTQYQWFDEPLRRADNPFAGWQSGLRFFNGKPKPALPGNQRR
jgi:hypothetical protein